MAQEKRNEGGEKDGNLSQPLTPPAVKGGSVPDIPMEGRGGTTAENIARPRDKEATNEQQRVVAGFTNTDTSGSEAGRSRYGGTPRTAREDQAQVDETEEG